MLAGSRLSATIPCYLEQGSFQEPPAASNSLLAGFDVGNFHSAASSETCSQCRVGVQIYGLQCGNVAEDWRVEFSETLQSPVSRHPNVPGAAIGSRASGTARIILFVLRPNVLMEAFLFPLSWERGEGTRAAEKWQSWG